MNYPLFTVDAFTDRPFAGNPAGVCLLDRPAEPAWMQAVAAEMNLSETAFLVPGEGRYGLRWFTPASEVDLCGHATLASAHVLWETGRLAADRPAVFDTASGELRARHAEGWIELDFPATPPEAVDAPAGLLAAVPAPARYVGRSRFDYLVEIEGEETLRALCPDLAALEALTARGVIVTSRAATPGFDFVSRFFAPAAGIPEDPVTGSAHCCLGPYWMERLGQSVFQARQVSRRGGTVKVAVDGERVRLGGQAVTIWKGALAV